MSDGPSCFACNGPATHVRERADFGESADRVYTCSQPACQPPGNWTVFPLDGAALLAMAPAIKETNGVDKPSSDAMLAAQLRAIAAANLEDT